MRKDADKDDDRNLYKDVHADSDFKRDDDSDFDDYKYVDRHGNHR